jgi:uncharacterized protein (DUF1800 family)
MAAPFWQPYAEDSKAPWTLRHVVHLHRCAGFAAAWDEMQRDLQDGPVVSVERLMAGKSSLHVRPDFDPFATMLADAAVEAGDLYRLQAAWFYRFLFSPDPLGEKLTLLWHDHFATANGEVRNVVLMQRQNATFRKHARGKFGDLAEASVREPALLLFLDANTNRKGHPNENLARELMELFTLGVGNYSEKDVKEAARALTGWTVDRERFVETPPLHDDGAKTILGKTGKWNGSDLMKILLKQPATAERIATKLCRLFFRDGGVSQEERKALAAGLREHGLDIAWAVGVIMKSKAFFADANLGGRVLSPVEFVTGAARALEMFDPSPSTLALADWAAQMGQELFEPPNVGGWPGGRAWIHTSSLIKRANYAAALIAGSSMGRPSPYDPTVLSKKYGFSTDAQGMLTFHHRLLFGVDPSAELRRRFAGADGKKMVVMLLSSPEAQLG